MPELTPRDAVTRAMAAMEIAESCNHPQIRTSFTNLAESWLTQAAQAARDPESKQVDESSTA
jgi:sirohydrochlorin ferrochelatase